jgi:hypothetical protein
LNTKISIQSKPSKPTYIVLLVSLSIHLGFILLIALAAKKSPLESTITVNEQTPLKSYIFTPKPLPKVSKPPEIEQVEVDSESTKSTIEQIAVPQETKPIDTIDTIIPADFTAQSDSVEQPPSVEQAPIDELPLKTESKKVNFLTNNAIKAETTLMSDTEAKYKSLIAKHLTTYHSNYSQQQAQQYRTLKKSPIIDTTNSANPSDIELTAPIVNVNCNNTGSQVVALISGLMNGTVKCESNNSFQTYIDQRLSPIPKKAGNLPKIANKVTLKSVNYSEENNSDDVN